MNVCAELMEHLIVFEILQPGSTWWANQSMDITMHKAQVANNTNNLASLTRSHINVNVIANETGLTPITNTYGLSFFLKCL